MPSDRPKNHVEMALEANLRLMGNPADTSGEPFWTKEQIAWMQRAYPPRCLGFSETVESHLRYAGIVDFVAGRVARYDRQWSPDEADPDSMEHV